MVDIHHVCDYIITKLKGDEDCPLNNLKLQKLLYYTQAWHLVFNNKPFFKGKFQAWVHGPVNRAIYDRFKDEKILYSEIGLEDVRNDYTDKSLEEKHKNHIDSVLEVYMKYTGAELEYMTHKEKPWIKARKGYASMDRCEVEIDENLMTSYYKERLNAEKD